MWGKNKQKQSKAEQEFLDKASKHGRVDTFTKKKKRHFGFNTETEYTVTYAPEPASEPDESAPPGRAARRPAKHSETVALEIVEQSDGQEKQTIVAGQQVTVGEQQGTGGWLTLENLGKGVQVAVAGMTLIAGAVHVANMVSSGKGAPLASPPSKQKR